jgi:hypothetical protein
MAGIKNIIATVQITISTTAIVKKHLLSLAATGLYGKNHAAAAERLIARGIEEAIKSGTIKTGQK